MIRTMASGYLHAVALANYTLAAALGYVVGAAIFIVKRRIPIDRVSSMILRGFKVASFGWAAHQSYWGINRWALAYGKTDLAAWLSDNAWVATAFYMTMWAGAVQAIVAAIWGRNARRGHFIAVLCAWALLFALFATTARADGIPRGLGHPKEGEMHWYDRSCCDMRDCEPVEAGAIMPEPGGFRVRYLTSQGVIAEGFLPFSSTGIRPSKDGREHACAIGARAACIYLPPGS